MENYKNMTPIELNVLINKTKDSHEEIKSNIKTLLDQLNNLETNINEKIKELDKTESEYVELMSILMEKK